MINETLQWIVLILEGVLLAVAINALRNHVECFKAVVKRLNDD